jgi:hypothetical protein
VDKALFADSVSHEPRIEPLLTGRVIGIVAKLNEALQERRPQREKQRLLCGMGKMIRLVGPLISNAAPQVRYFLQSFLAMF